MRSFLRRSDDQSLHSQLIPKQYILKLQCLKKSLQISKPRVKLPIIQSSLNIQQILNSTVYKQLESQLNILQSKHNYSLMKLKQFEKTKTKQQKNVKAKASILKVEVDKIKQRLKQLQQQIEEQNNRYQNIQIEYQYQNNSEYSNSQSNNNTQYVLNSEQILTEIRAQSEGQNVQIMSSDQSSSNREQSLNKWAVQFQ